MSLKNKIIRNSVLVSCGSILALTSAFGQTTVNFGFTGAPASWTVPNCVTSITVTAEGAQGGGVGGANGGLGSVVTFTVPVNPGDNVGIVVGGQGGCPGPGYNGGGSGVNSTDGNPNYGSCGGGGATNISINGVLIAVASGGGGCGGGSDSFNGGGGGGCATGINGVNTYGQGGGGGTQVAGGNGGAPWAGTPPGGQAGSLGQGGNGGPWLTAPGGGGGGGYYGGGGGGNDGCCTGANGGGGGGGGSSLTPGGGGCTPASNSGPGTVSITYTGGISATISDVLICEGETVTVTAVGVTGSVQWQTAPTAAGPWVNIPGATTISYVTSALFADACFRAEDTGGGCTSSPYSNEVCVAVSPAPAPFAGLDDSICFPAGYALMGTSSGGTTSWSQYTGPGATGFAPSPSNLNATATPTVAGMYQYILSETDPTGACPPSKDTVSILFAKEDHTTSFTDPLCYHGNDGTITINSTGNPGAVLYSFDGGTTFGASNTMGGFQAGTYTVVSQDLVGCTYQSDVTLVDPAKVIVLVSNDTTVCENGTATVSASATGGTTYTYHWSQTTDPGPVQNVSPTVPTNITVFAENEFGCVSNPKDIQIDMHSPISLSITPNDSICPGYDSQHTVTAMGGFMGYTYSWTANSLPMVGANSTIDVTPAVQTQYCVTVSDGCETTPKVICTNTMMREVPNPMFTADTTQECIPATITFENLTTMTLPSMIDSVTWEIDGILFNDPVTLAHEFTMVGTYDVWLEIYSNYGCHNSITVTDFITVNPRPVANFLTSPNPTNVYNTEIHTNNFTQGTNTYEWFFPGGSPGNTTEEEPTVIYPEEVANLYEVTLVATNEFFCTDTAIAYIDIQNEIPIYVPNAFTPDGDEYNEYWRVYIRGIDIYDFHLTVFNRWGEIVWESYNPEGTWDGSYGSTEPKTGTYVWVIEAKDKYNDKKYEWRGHVTVLK